MAATDGGMAMLVSLLGESPVTTTDGARTRRGLKIADIWSATAASFPPSFPMTDLTTMELLCWGSTFVSPFDMNEVGVVVGFYYFLWLNISRMWPMMSEWFD